MRNCTWTSVLLSSYFCETLENLCCCWRLQIITAKIYCSYFFSIYSCIVPSYLFMFVWNKFCNSWSYFLKWSFTLSTAVLLFLHSLLFTVMCTHILIFLWAYENLLCEYVLTKFFYVRVVHSFLFCLLVSCALLKSTKFKLVNSTEMNNSE